MKAKICFVIETDDANTAFMAVMERIATVGIIKESSLVVSDKKEDTLSALKEDAFSDWRQEVKDWLHVNKMNIRWLADKIGMSPASFKNLLYSKMNVTERVKNAVDSVMKNGTDKTINQ